MQLAQKSPWRLLRCLFDSQNANLNTKITPGLSQHRKKEEVVEWPSFRSPALCILKSSGSDVLVVVKCSDFFVSFFKSFKQCDHGIYPQVPMVMGGRWHGFRVGGDQHHLHVHLQVHIKKKR